jgi:hypothetical protein
MKRATLRSASAVLRLVASASAYAAEIARLSRMQA